MAVIFRPPSLLAFSKSSSSSLSSKRPPRLMAAASVVGENQRHKKLPILLFDVMDTLVRDPFYHHIPAFFHSSASIGITKNYREELRTIITDHTEIQYLQNHQHRRSRANVLGGVSYTLMDSEMVRMSMKELLEAKHPTAWAEFEKGLIDENELAEKFFKDGRPFDLEGLKECMVSAYSFVDGVEELLQNLKENDYELHAFTNYPIWYKMIEEKLKLSKYLSWTFCSCTLGKRKPDALLYKEVLSQLEVEPESCIFVDDRKANVEAAGKAGMLGLHFKNAEILKQDLSSLGVEVECLGHP